MSWDGTDFLLMMSNLFLLQKKIIIQFTPKAKSIDSEQTFRSTPKTLMLKPI